MHKVNEGDHMYDAFLQNFKRSSQNFEMNEGLKYTIRKIFEKFNELEEKQFEEAKKILIKEHGIQNQHFQREAIPNRQVVKRRHKMELLDDNDDYKVDFEQKLLKIMHVVSPHRINFDFNLIQEHRQETKIVYSAACFLCEQHRRIRVSAYICRSYLRVCIGNYTTHLKMMHEEAKEKIESMQVYIYISNFCSNF